MEWKIIIVTMFTITGFIAGFVLSNKINDNYHNYDQR